MFKIKKKDSEYIIGRIKLRLMLAFGKMESNMGLENILILKNRINLLNLVYGKKV
jgi:hypothetical protein